MGFTKANVALGLARDEFALVYQPLIAASSRRLHGVEALARWAHPTRGVVGPDSFLPSVERYGLMPDLTDWCLSEAAITCASWAKRGHIVPISVNLSATLLQDGDLIRRIAEPWSRFGLQPELLTLEITETALATDAPAAEALLARLRDAGFQVSVDDFGTGYTSLAMLKDFTVDEIKIDRSFVTPMRHSPADAAIVRSILELGHRLGCRVVAEGVEDGGTARLLEGLGCDVLQGYHFGRPMSSDEIAPMVTARTVAETGSDHPVTALLKPRRQRPALPAAERFDKDEQRRLAAVKNLGVLPTPSDQVLDDLAAAAAAVCGTPVSLVSLVDQDRQWFMSKVGTSMTQTPREQAFCAHAIRRPSEVMEVRDARSDPRFANNPLVTGEPHIRFYAGAPMLTDSGEAIGTICVIDSIQRALTDSQRQALSRLARIAIGYLQVARSEALMRRISDITRVLSGMSADTDISQASSTIAKAAQDILGSDGAMVMMADEPGSVKYRATGISSVASDDTGVTTDFVVDIRTEVATAHVVRTGEPLVVADAIRSANGHLGAVTNSAVATAFLLPMLKDTAAFGVLTVWWSTAQPQLSAIDRTVATMLADEATSTLARLQTLAELRRAADTDSLTGLLNRRAFSAGLKHLPGRSALIILDLDHFKTVNDRHGHNVGDRLLQSFAAHLLGAARKDDLVARWGGEEFAIALPGADIPGALSLLLRLRDSWDNEVTFSSGYTVLNNTETTGAAMERVDRALYSSKHAGRNRDTPAPNVESGDSLVERRLRGGHVQPTLGTVPV